MDPLYLTIETYLNDAEDPESSRKIDHNDSLHRQWLSKHIFWAVRNNREVHILGEAE